MSKIRREDTRYQPREFSSRGEWERYAGWLKRHAQVSFGLLPAADKTPLKAKIWDRAHADGFTVEKACFESLPGFLVTGNLFRPAKRRGKKAPGILCPHGHWPDGRLHDHDIKGSVPMRCAMLARLGFVVFSYDMVGYNDSCQVSHRRFDCDRLWGLSLMGLQALNSVRAIDFLQSLPDVDRNRIGMTGTSGGGTQTFSLMPFEERLTAVAPICMISYSYQGGCLCEHAPLLRIAATNVDLARAFAPRPVFLGSCTGDWTRTTPKVELPALKRIYRLYGAVDRVGSRHVRDEHNYNQEMRETVYGFFNRRLMGAKSDKPVPEAWFLLPSLPERMLWWGRKKPAPISSVMMKRLWRERAERALVPLLRSSADAREGLGPLLKHTLGVEPAMRGARAKAKPEGIRFFYSGRSLVIWPTGQAAGNPDSNPFFATYNRGPFSERVNEILNVLRGLNAPVRLVGKGRAGLWALAAAALSEKADGVHADVPRDFNPDRDLSWERHMNVPGIRQIGGLAPVFALIGKRPLALHGASGKVLRLARRFAR